MNQDAASDCDKAHESTANDRDADNSASATGLTSVATNEDASASTAPAVPSNNPCTAGKPEMYVLVAAIVKKMNIGLTMRSAVAFGAKEILVAGNREVNVFGDQGTERHIRVRNFDTLKHAVAWLKARGITICGIEITKDAAPVEKHPFRGPTAFLAGQEGTGLLPSQKAFCDHFVYIPHYGTGTASLNVTVATSIVLHHFAAWAGYAEAPRDGDRDKFTVVAPLQKRGATDDIDFAIRDARRQAKEDADSGIGLHLESLGLDDDGSDEDVEQKE